MCLEYSPKKKVKENNLYGYGEDFVYIRSPWFEFLSYLSSYENNTLQFREVKTSQNPENSSFRINLFFTITSVASLMDILNKNLTLFSNSDIFLNNMSLKKANVTSFRNSGISD